MHLGWVKEQSLTPQRYYLFLNLQKKVRFFTKKKKGGIGVITTSTSLKITHTINPKLNHTLKNE